MLTAGTGILVILDYIVSLALQKLCLKLARDGPALVEGGSHISLYCYFRSPGEAIAVDLLNKIAQLEKQEMRPFFSLNIRYGSRNDEKFSKSMLKRINDLMEKTLMRPLPRPALT